MDAGIYAVKLNASIVYRQSAATIGCSIFLYIKMFPVPAIIIVNQQKMQAYMRPN